MHFVAKASCLDQEVRRTRRFQTKSRKGRQERQERQGRFFILVSVKVQVLDNSCLELIDWTGLKLLLCWVSQQVVELQQGILD